METKAIQSTIWSDSVSSFTLKVVHHSIISRHGKWGEKEFTPDKHISSCCSFAIFNLQVLVGALVLSCLIDSCIRDPQSCAEESRPAAVTNGEAGARRRGRPTQVLPTAAKQRFLEVCTVHGVHTSMKQTWTYLHVNSRLSDLFILWTP